MIMNFYGNHFMDYAKFIKNKVMDNLKKMNNYNYNQMTIQKIILIINFLVLIM